MHVDLNYGKTNLRLHCPSDWDITLLRKAQMPLIAEPRTAINHALQNPLSSEPLAELARRSAKACILICDITRPVPNRLFLPPLVQTLLDAGIAPEAITILIATGLHRPNQGAELDELVGEVQHQVRVLNHDARNRDELVDLGVSKTRSTRVLINRHFVEADLRIATGLVEPHFMAGYSGGRKVIAPGIAGQETITTFHNAEFMAHPKAANCVLDGNPLHEEQLEIVKMLGGALALNTVIDEQRRLAFVNFGDIVQSHLQAVRFTRRYAEIAVERQFNTVITTAAGYPLDKTYYQTVKGMVGALNILAPGGHLIIASSCDEGLGSAEYIAAQQRLKKLGESGFLDAISRKSHADIDEWQTQMQLKPMALGQISLYTGNLTSAERALTGVEIIDSI